MDKTQKFIQQANKTHNNKYNYSETNYTKAKDKITIICPDHGEFQQQAFAHKSGQGCPKCKGTRISKSKTKPHNYYIKKFYEVHGDMYDYSKVKNIKGNTTKVNIICKKHGEFLQSVSDHCSKKGCPKCGVEAAAKKQVKDTLWFIEESKKTHKDKYNYDRTVYKNAKTKVEIYCKEHKEYFWQKPHHHINGSGCPKCGVVKSTEAKYDNFETFIEKAKKVHGDSYNYRDDKYLGSQINIEIECKKHGTFLQTPNTHIGGGGCPRCAVNKSKGEQEVEEFVSQYIKTSSRNRRILSNFELDIYCPKIKLAIEYNGLYWHTDKFLNKNYHLNKTNVCEDKNIQLIHIFEDEWIEKKDIVKSRLKNIIGITDNKIFARNTQIKEVPTEKASIFLENNHIQGKAGAKVKIGLYFEEELVSIMTLGKNRFSNRQEEYWEMIRFCNLKDTVVVGGASKLFKYFLRHYNPTQVISYADRRWSQGSLYDSLGFTFIENTRPNYFYLNKMKRDNRLNYRKSILVGQGYDKNKTERQIMRDLGYHRIYDCGHKKYIYYNT